jgi:hypothetical protein
VRRGRWYTSATSEHHRPRCRTTRSLASPRQSRQSVAPPARNDLAPTSYAAMPAAAATLHANARTSLVHIGAPKLFVKNATPSAGASLTSVARCHQSTTGRPRSSSGNGAEPARLRHHACVVRAQRVCAKRPVVPACDGGGLGAAAGLLIFDGDDHQDEP